MGPEPLDLAALYRAHARPIMHGLYAKGFTWQDAEDLTHFAFLQMLRYPPEPTNPRGWLWRVAHNAARSVIWHRTHFPAVAWNGGVEPVDPARAEATLCAAAGACELLALLDTLTADQRQVLLLTACGYSDPAIGRRMGRKANAIKALRFRARQAAQKRLAG